MVVLLHDWLAVDSAQHIHICAVTPVLNQQSHSGSCATPLRRGPVIGTSAAALVRARRAAAAARSELRLFTCAISSGVGEDTGTARLLRLTDRDRPGRLCVDCLHV